MTGTKGRGGGGTKNKERFEVVRSIYYIFDDLVFFSFVSVVVGSFWNNRDRAEVERKSKVSLIFP